jgi:hypothetical protein
MRSWYNRPWLVVLRYPDQKVALKLAQLAIDAALNDKVGYDQGQNRTYLAQLKAVGWEPSKITVACEAEHRRLSEVREAAPRQRSGW